MDKKSSRIYEIKEESTVRSLKLESTISTTTPIINYLDAQYTVTRPVSFSARITG
jgi:hypothetical protein